MVRVNRRLAIIGTIGAGAIIGGVIGGSSSSSTPVQAINVTPTAIRTYHAVGYWSPAGDVVGVVDVQGARIIGSNGAWVQVVCDGGGIVWIELSTLENGAVLTGA